MLHRFCARGLLACIARLRQTDRSRCDQRDCNDRGCNHPKRMPTQKLAAAINKTLRLRADRFAFEVRAQICGQRIDGAIALFRRFLQTGLDNRVQVAVQLPLERADVHAAIGGNLR